MLFRRSFWIDNDIKFRFYVNYEDDYLAKTDALTKANNVSMVEEIGYLWRSNLESATYSVKYIEDIKKKQLACMNDLRCSLESITNDNRFWRFFTNITLCKQYIEIIENISSKKEINPRKIVRYFNEYIYDEQFQNAINYQKYARKDYIKLNVLLSLLRKKEVCYVISHVGLLN